MTDQSFRPNPNVVVTTLEDAESVLLDLQTRQYYTLNETGSRIWQLLSEGKQTSDIAAALTDEFDVTEEDARHHVQMLISDLKAKRLIEEVPA